MSDSNPSTFAMGEPEGLMCSDLQGWHRYRVLFERGRIRVDGKSCHVSVDRISLAFGQSSSAHLVETSTMLSLSSFGDVCLTW